MTPWKIIGTFSLCLRGKTIENKTALRYHRVGAGLQLVVVVELLRHSEELVVGPEVLYQLSDAPLVVASKLFKLTLHLVHGQVHQPRGQARPQHQSSGEVDGPV